MQFVSLHDIHLQRRSVWRSSLDRHVHHAAVFSACLLRLEHRPACPQSDFRTDGLSDWKQAEIRRRLPSLSRCHGCGSLRDYRRFSKPLGAVLVMVTYLLAQLTFYYIRLIIGNRIRREFRSDGGLFWLGIASQLGSLVGAVRMYFLVNTYQVFHGRQVCQTYC